LIEFYFIKFYDVFFAAFLFFQKGLNKKN